MECFVNTTCCNNYILAYVCNDIAKNAKTENILMSTDFNEYVLCRLLSCRFNESSEL